MDPIYWLFNKLQVKNKTYYNDNWKHLQQKIIFMTSYSRKYYVENDMKS
jgi:hypothetical protein